MFMTVLISTLLISVIMVNVSVQGRVGFGGTKQDWGYITVRPNAHLFWWLYFTTYENVSNYTERPLIVWLQGGPGSPASGVGNFLEIGPLDAHLKKRKGSFVDNFNVLFVDSPVGVGFSYVSGDNATLSTDGEEISEDLYNFLKIFINTYHPEFKNVPLHIFGESYGGRAATELVHKIQQKEANGNEHFCNVSTLTLLGAYISPLDSIKHYAPLAFHLGLIDEQSFTRIDKMVEKVTRLVKNHKLYEAYYYTEHVVMGVLDSEIHRTSFHNILMQTNPSGYQETDFNERLVEDIMNPGVRNSLKIAENITWDVFKKNIYFSVKEDSVKSITDKIESILNTTNTRVIVVNGILDIIVNTAGTRAWLDRLNWQGQYRWFHQDQIPLVIDKITEGFSKKVDNLAFYAILRAGHYVPMDNLPVLNEILRLESVI